MSCVTSGTQSPFWTPSRTRRITISSATWPSVELNSPSCFQTSSGPFKKYMGQLSVQMLCLQLGETCLCTISFISICLVTSLITIKEKSRKRAKFKNWGSCRTLIQDKKRVSVGAIKRISSTSKVKRHSQDHRKIQCFLKIILSLIRGVSEQVRNKRESCGFLS